mmetsp:Transcript_57692/g.113582  ORF Transcript_57692/g.113582 Transcript_57692/m.113582 type:complete len:81 (+) Transcript_57692:1300-1542(+)
MSWTGFSEEQWRSCAAVLWKELHTYAHYHNDVDEKKKMLIFLCDSTHSSTAAHGLARPLSHILQKVNSTHALSTFLAAQG